MSEHTCTSCGHPIDPRNACLEMDDAGKHELYCLTCRPPGRGYALSDLQAMKDENAIQRELARGNRELHIIEAGGMDVLDALRKPR